MNMNLENLTSVQQTLINDLVKEFIKINPKQKDNSIKRFTFETISECNREEERFKQTMTKHNETMMKVFLKQLDNEIKDFTKEFGKALTLQLGYKNFYSNQNTLCYTKENFITENKNKILHDNKYHEIHLFLVSKTKEYGSNNDLRYNYCNDKKYFKIYVDFKRERVVYKLESGKEINVYKIVGLTYCLNEYLYKEKVMEYSTLDELIQAEKQVQKNIVDLAN